MSKVMGSKTREKGSSSRVELRRVTWSMCNLLSMLRFDSMRKIVFYRGE